MLCGSTSTIETDMFDKGEFLTHLVVSMHEFMPNESAKASKIQVAYNVRTKHEVMNISEHNLILNANKTEEIFDICT